MKIKLVQIIILVTECDYSKSSGWCHASGDPHYISYDGIRFDFMGTCRYLLTGVQQNASFLDQPWFNVQVEHRRAWNSEVAMTEHVWLHFNSKNHNATNLSYQIYMKIADPPQGQGMPSRISTVITEHYFNTSIPLSVNEMRNEDFTMLNYGDRVIVKTWFGLQLEYVAYNWALDIFIPDCYNDIMEGLCGNYNGQQADDLIKSDGTLESNVTIFGQSWQVGGSEDTCEGGPDTFKECTDQQVLEDCNLLLDNNGVFDVCLSTDLPVETFYNNCVFDYCLDPAIKCGIMGQYAQSCFRELAGQINNTANVCNWASVTGCAPECGLNSVYTGCANVCKDSRTCSNRNDNIDDCQDNDRFMSMCVCIDGFVLEDGVCIPEEECGCVTQNGASVSNGYIYQDCEHRCECMQGEYTCSDHSEDICLSECGCTSKFL